MFIVLFVVSASFDFHLCITNSTANNELCTRERRLENISRSDVLGKLSSIYS